VKLADQLDSVKCV